ncbi:MAG TPA: M14 family zinc carboxypeptidase [Chloroflexia bacterium]|nr:M14 family zinc carboxypeptidase [Chloroflexia bacterium]
MVRRLLSSILMALVVCVLLGAPNRVGADASEPPAPTTFVADWDPACYRTNEQVQVFLQGIAASYPSISALTDAGLSWEGAWHLWVLKLTNVSRPGPKPAIFLFAGQRPRDIAGPELLMRYISYLTQSYGVDPDVSWLLDNREVYIMPLANPDGYWQVYSNGSSWYKNTDNDDGCANPLWWGTDLNRNYPFHWNEVGVSGDPCDLSYRGPSALSEPESQHVLSAFGASGADMVLSLQAPGPAVLYPWGWSAQPAPDTDGLDALGWNLGRLNGTSRQSVRSHNADNPVSGILDDTVYGVYGVPAYTFNIGASLSPQCADLDLMWEAQRAAFLYATKAVGSSMSATLAHAFGPTPRDLAISSGISPESIQVTGVLSANYGVVMGAVYSVDEVQGDGAGTAMSGNFGGGTANVSANVDTSDLTNGRHLLFVQGKNDANQWGVLSSAFFTVTGSVITPSPTPQWELTPSPTSAPTNTRTATSTYTPAPSATSSRTATPVITPAPTTTALSATNTATGTPYTRTVTPTRTVTSTRTVTPTRTATPTRSVTPTRTYTATRTPEPPSTATPLPCAEYSDVYPSQFFYRAVDWLTCRHIVSGYSDGTFRPYNPATRAQILKMVVLGEEWELYDPGQPTFADVSPEDWFYLYVETAFKHGVVGGYPCGEGSEQRAESSKYLNNLLPSAYRLLPSSVCFRPGNNVTRAQLSKIIVSARLWPLLDPLEPHFTDVPRGSTFYTYIETAQAHAVVGGYGDGTFRPDNEATRGQLAKMLYVALNQ